MHLFLIAMPNNLCADNSPLQCSVEVQPDSLLSLPPNFSIGLDIERLKYLDIKSSVADQTYYFPDTVTVLSTDFQPKRYIFTYSPAGYQLSELIQELQNSIWTNSSFTIRTVDNNGNILNSQTMSWVNGLWTNETKMTYTYTSNNLVLTLLSEQWQDNQWVGNIRQTYTYDVFGNNVALLVEINISGNWINESYTIFTYDEFNNMVGGIRQIWETNFWTNQQQYIYEYNQNQRMVYSRIESWVESEWENLFEENYTYDGSGNVVGYTGRIWAEDNWINYEKYAYEYNNLDYLTTAAGQTWQESGWVNTEKGQYEYNSFGGRQNSLIQKWISNEWANFSQLVNAYDMHGNALISDFYVWNGETWVQNTSGFLEMFYSNSLKRMFFVGYRAEATYISIEVGVSELLPADNPATFYPNPVVDESAISFTLPADDLIKIDIINSSGNLVNSFSNSFHEGQHMIAYDFREFPSGIYFIIIHSSTYNQVIKSIKQ